MTTEEDEIKNGLIKTAFRWPGGIVPYYIKEEDFGNLSYINKACSIKLIKGSHLIIVDEEDIEVIKNAIEDYHENTCIRFRPYKKSDNDYITIEAKSSGCWSLVGRHDHGQVVNLQNPGCVQHGVIIHELMHALGFYHQQSAADRDEWVAINWENIKPGKHSIIFGLRMGRFDIDCLRFTRRLFRKRTQF